MKTGAHEGYPLRARNALELLDIAVKLYQKYFLPLLACSALVWLVATAVSFIPWLFTGSFTGYMNSLIGAVPLAGLTFFLLLPFLYGGGACCLDAAIEARQVTASDCLRFAAGRYWRTLKAQFVTAINGIFFFFLFLIITWGGTAVIVFFGDMLNVGDVMFYLAAAILLLIYLTMIYIGGVLTLMPLVACIEGKQKAVLLRKRCFMLAWSGARRMLGLVVTHFAAIFALSLIFTGVTMYGISLSMLSETMRGYSSDAETFFYLLGAMTSSTVIGVIWSPFYIITLGTFYIDARVRKEAFDLECAVAGRGKMETTPVEQIPPG